MDFGLTEEQLLFRDSAAKFVQQLGGIGRDENSSASDGREWQALAEAGFLALGLPEEFGGMGGFADIAVVAEEFGRGPLTAPYSVNGLLVGQLLAASSHAGTLLPSLIAGDIRIALAHAGPPAGEAAPARAEPVPGGYRLDGQKCLVLGAEGADQLLISATVNGPEGTGGLSFFLVPADAQALEIFPVPLIDGSASGDVAFADLFVPSENLVGEVGAADGLLDAVRPLAILAAGAEMLGLAGAAIDATTDYVQTRKQFGAPLAALQVVRHRIADMVIDREMARAALDKLLASIDDPAHHDPVLAAALAKTMIDEACIRITRQAIQLHGAMGLTEECGVGRYYARAALLSSMNGSAAAHAEIYARRLAASILPAD